MMVLIYNDMYAIGMGEYYVLSFRYKVPNLIIYFERIEDAASAEF